MNFAQAVTNQSARTTNGMLARASTNSAAVDLFYAAGAMRGKDIVPQFAGAYAQSPELALRIALWLRDVRGGAGERELFRSVLRYLEKNDVSTLLALLPRVPELGRWDDLLVFTDPRVKTAAFTLIRDELLRGEPTLAAKWMPRERSNNPEQTRLARELARFMGFTGDVKSQYRQYRKLLSRLTPHTVVEPKMCAGAWDNIDFNTVASGAHALYRKAFNRRTTKYAEYVNLLSTNPEQARIAAGAVYPYQVLKGVQGMDEIERKSVLAQWAALPNYVGDARILPMVDVSGSMTCTVGGQRGLRCLDVAVALGLYLADKNTGEFADTFLTFSRDPQLLRLQGNVLEKQAQMVTSDWGTNTNLHKAFDRVLQVATENSVPQAEMPEVLLILSDMQFDEGCDFDETAVEMMRRKYEAAGYTMPLIVFWNLNHYGNVPAASNQEGIALISGFSPAIMQSVLGADFANCTPESIMRDTVMVDRYKPF